MPRARPESDHDDFHLQGRTIPVEAPGPPPLGLRRQKVGVEFVNGRVRWVEDDVAGAVGDQRGMLTLGGLADAFDIELCF